MAMWGSLAGGVADGFSGGVDLAAKLRAQQEALRLDKVKAAAAAGNLNPQMPPSPGQSSMPAGPPPPTHIAGAGGPPQQMAMPGAQPMPAPPAAPPPSMGPPPAAGPPPAPPPVGSTGAPVSATAAPQPPAQGGGMDPARQEAQQTLTSITQSIKAANPGISMLDLFDATELSIGQMKGVNDALKNQMVYDTNTAKLMFGLQVALEKIQSNDRNVDVKALASQTIQELKNQGLIAATEERTDAQRDVAETNRKGRNEAAGITGQSRIGAANIGADSRIKTAGIGADSRRDVAETNRKGGNERAQIGAGSRERVAGTGADARRYAADRGYDRGVDSAGVAMGKPATRGGGSASSAPPFPPTANHTATGPDGSKWKADGKTWKKVG